MYFTYTDTHTKQKKQKNPEWPLGLRLKHKFRMNDYDNFSPRISKAVL